MGEIITEKWQKSDGPGGLPRWTVTGWATFERSTIQDLERNAIVRPKFTPLPNTRRLSVLAVDGSSVSTVSINPKPGYPRITNCVKIGPVRWQQIAPEQTSGEYNGKAIISYRVQFQQLEYNHI